VLRSTNDGKTWGSPIKIAKINTALLTNPDIPNPTSLNETVRAGDYIPDVGVDRSTGALYMVFADSIGGGINHVKLTKSTNGGKSWTTPVDVTGTPNSTHSFNGTVEVTADGTVAVMYYDFRNNTSAAGLPTDVWLTHSHDGGATWSEQHVYGPFDMEDAPVARGWFLGDYQGLAPIGDDLIMFFAVPDGNDLSAIQAVRAAK
jgi:Neuraminidase (sialidase)